MRQQPPASAHRSGRQRRLLMQRAAVAALALGQRVTRAGPQAATSLWLARAVGAWVATNA